MAGTCCTPPPPHAVPFLCKKLQRTRRPCLTPSPCSPTGSDALVGILVVDKEEPRSKRGHGDACASAGGVRTAMLASPPLREGRAPAVRVRRGPGRFGTGQTSSVPTSYMLGPEVHASLTCVGFTNDPHSLICRKATRLGFTLADPHINTSALDRGSTAGRHSRQGSSPAAPLTPSVRTALRLRSGVVFNSLTSTETAFSASAHNHAIEKQSERWASSFPPCNRS